MSAADHRELSRETPVSCAVITVSDTRNEDDDASGEAIKARLRDAGHPVEFYRIVPDDGEAIRQVLLHLAGQVEVVVTTGGTGVSRRDTTVEVAERLIQKALPGFGELFRALSFETVGAAAMLSRATAGVYGHADGPAETLLFCCPGSTDACALALDRLILPDLAHVVWEVVRQAATPPPDHHLSSPLP
ncbi:molybdenum cofactor biosynthesis protein B [Rubrivirga sp. S365]|uniref:MogA/MoaB family molybdenum cofactor biosynthesis protein n=1 Tax=Rubrivirga sp. S365 TaxID=3076080 RepID=UPI0028C9636B|nr:molybdenum cofactor biosynthesis protein B [Rubrivirga sp. S365]MDT7856440.1 molybdenum cofactor biosynthesis protein B [Rubrivirga sp. S365]